MASYEDKLVKLTLELFKINAVKFGEYKTKVGLMTPVYCDLRLLVSYPNLMQLLAELIIEHTQNVSHDLICGVPYTALPIATAVSLKTNVPMVMRRKEVKNYGTKNLIEGAYKEGDSCIIIEDVVTSGSSILETVRDLTNAGIKVTNAVVLLNREQGGETILTENGINMHALLTLTQMLTILKDANCVDDLTCKKVSDYICSTQVDSCILADNFKNRLKMTFHERLECTSNPVTVELFKIMYEKQSNLCVAADLISVTEILNLAEQVGPHICLFKTHIDIVEDFHSNFPKQLKDIAERHNFILFEDRKFADIGKTVELQYSKGIYRISSWAKLVTAHSLTGRSVMDAIKQSTGLEKRGVFLLAETSAADSLISENYTTSTLNLASEYSDVITGIVCQTPLFLDKPGFIQLTPGVQLDATGDNLGQRYSSPDSVILEKGADIAVVGRGITRSPEPGVAAEKYKDLLWDAYMKRIVIE